MRKKRLIPVWVGIVVLSGMFLMGQETWTPPACVDNDGDGFGSPASALCSNPEPDCDDSNGHVYPNAPELCDGTDNQCPGDARYGQIDEGCASCRIVDVGVEDGTTYRLAHPLIPKSTGDLWPCAWGPDDRLYTANGDGLGFGFFPGDIVFNAVDGYPPHLTGKSFPRAFGKNIAGLWAPGVCQINRKPTGMTCVDGDIYLFFQNLKHGFSDNPFGDAPHGSISVSRDKGRTWWYEPSAPMFTDHVFTTGFFLDYGQCQAYAPDEYVYVYGLDYNWRFSPGFLQTRLYLARVPRESILDLAEWEFFTGLDGRGDPTWSPDIAERAPVIEDHTEHKPGQTGISQGSVVYIAALDRYLYSSWADCAWVFYESGSPWGPWTRVTVIDWTVQGWTEDFHGGYATVVPSKFLDPDGQGGWIVSSVLGAFENGFYNLGMRRFTLEVEPLTAPPGM